LKNCFVLPVRAKHCVEAVCEPTAKRVYRKNLKHNATASTGGFTSLSSPRIILSCNKQFSNTRSKIMFDSMVEFIKSAVKEQIIQDPIWASIALVGQIIFGSRFVLQWLVSEYKKKSHVPNAFWYISLIGSLLLLSYSIHLKNPVFMLGFSLNTLIYIRNIHLSHIHAKKQIVSTIDNAEN